MADFKHFWDFLRANINSQELPLKFYCTKRENYLCADTKVKGITYCFVLENGRIPVVMLQIKCDFADDSTKCFEALAKQRRVIHRHFIDKLEWNKIEDKRVMYEIKMFAPNLRYSPSGENEFVINFLVKNMEVFHSVFQKRIENILN